MYKLMKLHIGCGERRLHGFTHIDVREDVGPDIVCAAEDLKLPDESADLVYACHILEHVRKADTQRVLKEWRRVLIPGGQLLIAVPDIGNIMRAYVELGVGLERLSGLLWGRQDHPDNFHYQGWDYESLANELRVAGYYDVQRWYPEEIHPKGYHDISFAMIWTEDNDHIAMSLNLAAKKIGA